ncbi:MAG: alpha/beta hydrolase [Burkholderiaceae bacterium]
MTPAPRIQSVKCLSPAGFHSMSYREWGDADNPRVLICVHGLSRVGSDFDRLARALQADYRVVCPDVAGRGESEWLAASALYNVAQYAADMATLMARLDVPRVDWLGSSMGGLIGMAVAGQPGAPIGKLILNDVGPRIEPASLERIGRYLGDPHRFADFNAALAYVKQVSAPFGLRDEAHWREITASVIRPAGDGFRLHYDPRISEALRAITPELVAVGEAAMWQLYDRITAPTLLVRGEFSDLLSPATAAEMTRRGPRARWVEAAGVGHAPMFMDEAQIALVRHFLLGD